MLINGYHVYYRAQRTAVASNNRYKIIRVNKLIFTIE